MAYSLKNRIALITGASRGIGAAVAKRFAAEGAHVILVARTMGALEALDDEITSNGGTATLVTMDLADHDKIDQLGMSIAQRFGKLDILVGNAAMLGELTPLTHADAKMWDRVMAVNLTANWRLIRICDPLLRLSDAPRVMFVTSGVTESVHPYWGAYATSKAALEMLVNTYAAEVQQAGVKVNLIDPGVVRTAMRAAAMPGEDAMRLPKPEDITDIFLKLALPEASEHGAKLAA